MDENLTPTINLGYGLNKYSYDINEQLRSQIYGDLVYRNDFQGNQELRAGIGFRYYLK